MQNKISIKVILLTIIVIFASSCAEVIYSTEGKSKANTHQTIAIMPPKFSNSTGFSEQNPFSSFGLKIQEEINLMFLRNDSKNINNLKVMEISVTNAKLFDAEYHKRQMKNSEIAEILGVDAILFSNLLFNQFLANDGISSVPNSSMSLSNQVDAGITIYDSRSNEIIWNFKSKATGNSRSNPISVTKKILKRAFKRLPYKNSY